jgi:hypothetical protein
MVGPAAPGGVVSQLPRHDRPEEGRPGPPGMRPLHRVALERLRRRVRRGHRTTTRTARATIGTAVTTSADRVNARRGGRHQGVGRPGRANAARDLRQVGRVPAAPPTAPVRRASQPGLGPGFCRRSRRAAAARPVPDASHPRPSPERTRTGPGASTLAVQVAQGHPGPQLAAPGGGGDRADHLVVRRPSPGGCLPACSVMPRPPAPRRQRRRPSEEPTTPTRRRATLEPRESIRATSSWPV